MMMTRDGWNGYHLDLLLLLGWGRCRSVVQNLLQFLRHGGAVGVAAIVWWWRWQRLSLVRPDTAVMLTAGFIGVPRFIGVGVVIVVVFCSIFVYSIVVNRGRCLPVAVVIPRFIRLVGGMTGLLRRLWLIAIALSVFAS